MSRSNTSLRFLIIPVLMACVVGMAACGAGSADEKTLFTKYFMSSKIGDNLTLANIATVVFNPQTDGQMMSFNITAVTEEKTTPLQMKASSEELRKAIAEENDFSKKKRDYQDANATAIEKLVKMEQTNKKITGKEADLQKTWSKWRDDAKAMAQKVSEVRKKANEFRPIVEISAQDQRNPIDVTAYDCDLISKDVTIEGQVKPPTGDTVTKSYVFTLQRATLKNVKDGKDQAGRWVITGRKDAANAK